MPIRFEHGWLIPRILLATVLFAASVATDLAAQRVSRMPETLLAAVMPGATRFAAAQGDPPVISAFAAGANGQETLVGYVFLTSDLPPEQFGYSGPIEALVGMRPDGTLTGMRVTDYRESYMQSMGDFLRTPGFQEQFAGKHIGDPFQVWGDVDGISRVSISVRALSRGVRDAARRVANARGFASAPTAPTGGPVEPWGLSWFELRQAGFVERFEVTEPGEGSAGIALAYIANDRLGEYLLGAPLYERARGSAARRGGADNLMLYAIDGSRLRLFRQQGWAIAQDGDTTAIDPRNVVSLGLPSGGIVSGEATMVGIMLVDSTLDASRPFTFVYDLDDLGVHTVDYVSREARVLRAEAEARAAAEAAAAAAASNAAGEPPADADAPEADTVEDGAPGGASAEASAESATGGPATAEGDAARSDEASRGVAGEGGAAATGRTPDGSPAPPGAEPATSADAQSADGRGELDFVLTEDESLLERTFAGVSWSRVALVLLVIGLATAAFATKAVPLRWASLAATLVLLGFVDGGFLSVSHITSGIWAGVGVYVRDVPLLLLVTFTVVTTLVWGRVFCGFLCPFGALQDFIDRIVPRAWKRPLSRALHDRAIYAKYVILAVIVVPPLLGSRVSTYQYFEPFGTVFFLSPSMLLWAIAAVILGASVIIPRFYCRYACPLGAALGLLSIVSLRRIERVEHCTLCKVCEQKCPTGAITGPDIRFSECVRCNVCEVQLIEKTGVCRHDLEDIRPRLVQLTVGAGTGGDRV